MHRWEFELLSGETREEMEDPDRVWSLLAPWMSRDQGKLERAVVYRFHATIAETFRQGRVFLVGDSAHQTPPFMGQGLCSGMRDVNNLIWKIAHVAGRLAGDSLLDTYTEERRPMAVAMVNHSVNTGKLIDAYAAVERGGPEPSSELKGYAYGGSAVLPHLSTGLLSDDDSDWIGQPVPQCRVSTHNDAGIFDKIVGPHWAVLSKDDPRSLLSDESQKFWERLDTAFVSVPEPEGAMLGLLLAHEMVVVRPDRIVFAVTDKLPCLANLD
jgi:3-(3-hydroxy-phenyl)propionate hydroxylase